jgi:signal transduction histidine kinase
MASVDPRLQRLLDAVLAVAGDLEVDAVLERVVGAACELVGARFGALGELDESGERLRAFVHHGMDPADVALIGPLPTGHGLLGQLMRDPRPLRLADLAQHPASIGLPPGHPPMHSFIGAPIRIHGEVFGNLYLTEKLEGGAFDEDDESAIVALAAVAGSAIANARLAVRSRELSVSRERERIARDLHDTVIQNLFAIGLGLRSAIRELESGGGRPARRVDDAIDAIDAIAKEIRSTIFALNDDHSGTSGTRSRLLGVIDEMAAVLGFTPRVRLDGPIDAAIDTELTEQLVPVLRETLTNVAKHARASSVTVRLEVAASELELEICDDGIGMPAPKGTEDERIGFGLANLRQRAAAHGGSVSFGSVAGGGARVLWRVPI